MMAGVAVSAWWRSPGVCVCVLAATLFCVSTCEWLIRRRQIEAVAKARTTLGREIAELKHEAARYNTPSTFAKCAKLQRAAAVKERELAALAGQKAGAKGAQALGPHMASFLKAALGIGAAVLLWNVPVAQLPSRWLWPFNRFLVLPHWGWSSSWGWVAAGPFAYLCVQSSNALIQAVLPLRVPAPG